MCKRIITIILAICLVASLALSASAVTLSWDFSKARQSINNAATDIVEEVEYKYTSWTDYFANWIKWYYNLG